MIKRLLLFSLIIYFYSTQAQQLLVGIKSGLGINNTNSDAFTDKVNKYSVQGGFTFDYIAKSKVLIGADVLYCQRGFGNNYLFADNIFTGSPGGTSTVYFNFNYISIPLKVGYAFGDKLNGYGNIAIIPSYLISGSFSETGYSSDRTSVMNKKDLAGQIELGMGYYIAPKLNLTLSGSYYNSVTSASTYKFFNGYSIRNYGLVFSVGLKYKLNVKL